MSRKPRGRERFDDKITAGELKVGDELHLTFMGGDDYVEIESVRAIPGGKVKWTADFWGPMSDEVDGDSEVWIRKPTALFAVCPICSHAAPFDPDMVPTHLTCANGHEQAELRIVSRPVPSNKTEGRDG